MALIDGNYSYRPTYKPAAKPTYNYTAPKPAPNKTQTIDGDWRKYQQQEAAAKAAAAQAAAQRQAAAEAARQRQAAILKAQQQQQQAAAQKAAQERQAAIEAAQRAQAARIQQEQIAAAKRAQDQNKRLAENSAPARGYWAQNIATQKKPVVETAAKKANYSLTPNTPKGYWATYMANPPDPQDIQTKKDAAEAWRLASIPEPARPKGPSLADKAANLLRNAGEGWDKLTNVKVNTDWFTRPINEMSDAIKNKPEPSKNYSFWDAYRNATKATQDSKETMGKLGSQAITQAADYLGQQWAAGYAGPSPAPNKGLAPYAEGNADPRYLEAIMRARQPDNYAAYLDSGYADYKKTMDEANEKRLPWSQLNMLGTLSGMLTGAGSTPTWDRMIAEQAVLPVAGRQNPLPPSMQDNWWGPQKLEPMGPYDKRYIAEQTTGQQLPYKSTWKDYFFNGGVEPFNTYGPQAREIITAGADLEAAAAAGPNGLGANWQDSNFFGDPKFYGPPDPVVGEAPYNEPGDDGGGGGYDPIDWGGGSYMNYDTGYYSDRPSKRLGGYSRAYGGPSYAQGNAGGYGGVGYSQGGSYGGGGGGGYNDIYTGYGSGVAADGSGYSYNQYQQKPGDYWSQLARWVI